MVTDRANVAIANKYEVAYRLSIGLFTFYRPKGQGQGHVQFHCQYLANGNI